MSLLTKQFHSLELEVREGCNVLLRPPELSCFAYNKNKKTRGGTASM
jgi:hypothetical protein